MAAEFEYSRRRSFWQRWGLGLGLGVAGVCGVYVIVSLSKGDGTAARQRTNDVVMIRPVPPPPPPPPVPQPPQPKPDPVTTPREEMVEQTPVQEESKPDESPSPPEALGTGITGPGGADMGLSSSGNGGRIGGGGSGQGGGSRFGWYAAKLQRSIREALASDSRTRAANFNARKMSVKLDASGRITGVQLSESTGDRALDAAIRAVLVGLQLEPRPEGMPASVHLRIAAARPAS